MNGAWGDRGTEVCTSSNLNVDTHEPLGASAGTAQPVPYVWPELRASLEQSASSLWKAQSQPVPLTLPKCPGRARNSRLLQGASAQRPQGHSCSRLLVKLGQQQSLNSTPRSGGPFSELWFLPQLSPLGLGLKKESKKEEDRTERRS